MAQKLADYALLYQQCSDQDWFQEGTTDHFIAIHTEAYKEWTSDSTNLLFEPPLGNEKKKAAYFAKCDEICWLKPLNLHEYVTIWTPHVMIWLDTFNSLCKVTFACWAGIQVIQNQELTSMSNREEVMKTAKQLLCVSPMGLLIMGIWLLIHLWSNFFFQHRCICEVESADHSASSCHFSWRRTKPDRSNNPLPWSDNWWDNGVHCSRLWHQRASRGLVWSRVWRWRGPNHGRGDEGDIIVSHMKIIGIWTLLFMTLCVMAEYKPMGAFHSVSGLVRQMYLHLGLHTVTTYMG